MNFEDKPLVWLHGEIKTPPFSQAARLETGFLLRKLQKGEKLSMPHSRPMPSVGAGCHELRIRDQNLEWRIMYHIAANAIVILEAFEKKTKQTPQRVINDCKRRLRAFETSIQ